MADCPVFPGMSKHDQEWVERIYNAKEYSIEPDEYFPRRLYQYKAMNDGYAIKQIEKQQIHFSSPSSFNDPYDSFLARHIVYKKLENVFLVDNTKLTNIEIENILSKMIKIQNQSVVSCLTTDFDNMLMWAYYSKHYGVCIEYNIEATFSDPQREQGRLYGPYPAIYAENIDAMLPAIEISSSNLKFDKSIQTLLMMLKSKIWQHEMEWRFYNLGKNMKNDYNVTIPVSKVYCGMSISDKDKEKVIEAAEEAGCSVVQMALSRTEFGLVEGKTLYNDK